MSPVTNAVRANIDQALRDLSLDKPLRQTVTDMIWRDIEAMTTGGPEQGKHFIDAGRAWIDGRPNKDVGSTYRAFHEEYKSGWLEILAACGLVVKFDWQLDAIVRSQTAIAESAALQLKNGSVVMSDVDDMMLVLDLAILAWTRRV